MFKSPVSIAEKPLSYPNTFVSCEEDPVHGEDAFIIEENCIYHYETNHIDEPLRRILSHSNIACVKRFGKKSLGSEHLLMLTNDDYVEVYRIRDSLGIIRKKVDKIENKMKFTNYLIFFNSNETEIYICWDRIHVYTSSLTDLLSSSPFFKSNLFYTAQYEILNGDIILDGVSEKSESFFTVERNVGINRLYFATFPVDFRGRPRNLESSHSSGFQSYQASQFDRTMLIVTVPELPGMVVVTAKETIIFGFNILVFRNHGIDDYLKKDAECRILPKMNYAYRNNKIHLSIYSNSGKVLESTLQTKKRSQLLHWTLKKSTLLESFTPGTIVYCQRLSDQQLIMVSKIKGIMIIDSDIGRILHTIPYQDKIYFDSQSIKYDDGEIKELISCGAYCKSVGFVESWCLKLGKSTIKIIEHFDPKADMIEDFWEMTKGICWYDGQIRNELGTIAGYDPIFVTHWGSVLTKKDVLRATKVSYSDLYCVALYTNGEIFLLRGKDQKLILKLQEANICQRYAIAAEMDEKDPDITRFIVTASGCSVQMYEYGNLAAAISTKTRTIRDICIKRVHPPAQKKKPSDDRLLIVSSDDGYTVILQFFSSTKEIRVVYEFQLESYRSTGVCDVVHAGGQSLVLVYNDAKTRVLDVIHHKWYELPLGFRVKKIRHRGGNKYTALTLDDQFVVFKWEKITSPTYDKKLHVSQRYVYTQIARLRNPNFVLLAAESTHSTRQSHLVIFDLQEMRPKSTFEIDTLGTVTEILILQAPHSRKCLVSFCRGNGAGSILYLFSINATGLTCCSSLPTETTVSRMTQHEDKIVTVGGSSAIYRIVATNAADITLVRETGQYEIKEDLSCSSACFLDPHRFLNVISPWAGLCVYNLEQGCKHVTIPAHAGFDACSKLVASFFGVLTETATLIVKPTSTNIGSDNLSGYAIPAPKIYVAGGRDERICMWEITPAGTASDSLDYQIENEQEPGMLSNAQERTVLLPQGHKITRLRPVCSDPPVFLVSTVAGLYVVVQSA